MSVLRTDLIFGLLEVARWNLNRQAGEVRIFEVGKVFASGAGRSGTEEEERVAGLLVCETCRAHWHEKKQALDFYDVKGIVEAYLDSMAQAKLEIAPVQDRWYEEGGAGKILLGGKEVGCCGRLHRDVVARFDFDKAVYGFDISLSEVLPFFEEARTFEPLARYPAVDRDFAMVVSESLVWGELLGEIRETDTELIESVEVFDVYRGKPLGEGEKSLAFSVRFRSKERTLLEGEVSALCERIVERLSKRFGARLRS
jgi:phenylalanyl-tRNA synthetase beta chain